ncbi:MAG: DNA-protecting protein DprA [Deltaproteobacteria bacterium]|nr:DNA-protecting protein DprA [Deltaproteobacteria bacterium]
MARVVILFLFKTCGMKEERLKYWLALRRIKGVCSPEFMAFLNGVNDAKDVFEMGGSGPKAEGLKVIFERVRNFPEWGAIERELEFLEKNNDVRVTTIKDASYPKRLKEIYDPPIVLYAKGRVFDEELPAVAVVGTRRASHYGLSMAESISADLAASGVVIVSGLARGCDSAAHRGALKAGGKTVAVLGTGIDVVYPKENRSLFEEIEEKGLLLSEFAPWTPPHARNFPMRNRIISGVSLGVIVVEAPARSGAMMTARLALEQNRDLFALPGQAGAKKSGGANKLIKDGATLIEGAEDILSAFFPGLSGKNGLPTEKGGKKRVLGVEEARIDEILEDGAMHIDSIAGQCAMAVEKVSALLLDMELKGLVEHLPGKFYARRQ